MTHNDFCTCSTECSGECPNSMNCPLDSNDTSLSKDRTISRRRHHDSVRQKNRNNKSLDVVTAKADKLSDKATTEEIVRAEKNAKTLQKKFITNNHHSQTKRAS